MNKYLYKKIEQTKGGAYFENLIFIANEVAMQNQSKSFEEFTELEPIEIATVLGWNKEESILKLIQDEIEDESLAGLLLNHDRTGFLAECRMPSCSNFRFSKGKKTPSSWSVHGGICRVFWIYADSIGELVEKLQEKTEAYFLEDIEDFKTENPCQ